MSDSIFLVGDDGSLAEARTTAYSVEAELQKRLAADLRALGIPRLDGEQNLMNKRPNIPLDQLTNGRAERLLAIVDSWLRDVRAHAAEPEAASAADDEGGR